MNYYYRPIYGGRYCHYLPIRDRITKIIKSEIGLFLQYPVLRRAPVHGYLDDIYDGSNFKYFNSLMLPGEVLIAIQICWDGADLYNHSGKSIWPVTWSLLNFPPELRDKLHLGMHCASFDDGSEATLSLFCEELLSLWNDPIIFNGKVYKVALISAVFDGKAYDKFTRTTGASAFEGCNKCHFEGVRFGKGVRFVGYQRYLAHNDSRREKTVRTGNYLM